tara:strand:- start:21943 stop:23166 length:1224 start_codon:yes stop_codon:yes gene_type:complete
MENKMDDLLKEAIADAKAVRETALANAKVALEEAFTPRLKSMLSKKIQHEMEDAEEDGSEEPVAEEDALEDEADQVVPAEEEGGPDHVEEQEDAEEDDSVEEQEDAEEDDSVEEQEDAEEDDSVEEQEDAEEDDAIAPEEEDELDLEAILAELEADEDDAVEEEYDEQEVGDGEEEVPAEDQPDANSVSENDVSSDIGKADNKVNNDANDSSKTGAQGPEGEGSDSAAGKENSDDEVVDDLKESSDDSMAPPAEDADVDVEDDIDLEEVLKALSEEDAEEEDAVEETAKLKKEIKEHRDVVKYLRAKLNEVNLLNAKLLFSNKLFRAFGLTNEQKMKVVETFDRAHNLREIKLVYSTLAESFQGRKAVVKESKGSSSKAVASTKPSKKVISEGSDIKARFQKLANIL